MSKTLAKGKPSKSNFDFTNVSKKKYPNLEGKGSNRSESKSNFPNKKLSNKPNRQASHPDSSTNFENLPENVSDKTAYSKSDSDTASFWQLLNSNNPNHQPRPPRRDQKNQENQMSEPTINTEQELESKLENANSEETRMPLKSFENNMEPKERNLLLTSMILSKQDEIDQHLAKKSWHEDDTQKEQIDKNDFPADLALEKEVDLERESLIFNNKQSDSFKENSQSAKTTEYKDWEFMSKSRQKVQKEFDLDKRNWSRNSQPDSVEKKRIENKEQEVLEKQQKILQAQQSYQRQQQKSQANFILKVVSLGCLLAVLLFYFQGWQPLVLSQITTKNQEKIQALSRSYQTKVGDYFTLIQDLNDQSQNNPNNQCQLMEYKNIQTDAKKIEDLINQKLQPESDLQQAEKYWIFGLDQIDQEYDQAFSRYRQSLTVYTDKSDYLVDYLYFLQQRNSWLLACQNIQETNSLAQFEQLCQDFATKNQEYKQKRQSKFWSSLDPIIESFEPLCQKVDTTTSPSQWRQDWLVQYNFLTKYRPDNDNEKLYQMNEQTLAEFQTRSRNIYTTYEQKTEGWGYLYLLNFQLKLFLKN